MERRSFIRNGIIAGTSISSYNYTDSEALNATKPIMVSTWDFGKYANAEGWKILSANGHALDAIEQAARVTEADESNKTVGYGGYPDRDGRVTLDACIMDESGNCGSVMAIEHIKHPISVARKVMEKTPHIILVGDGALQFALENGFFSKVLNKSVSYCIQLISSVKLNINIIALSVFVTLLQVIIVVL